jgi:hypothetical protein
MLIWIIVAVVRVAFLGSAISTYGNGPSRRSRAEGTTWWASKVEGGPRHDRVPTPEEALDA